MANNDDRNPRRHLSRPEDNPFIAFRRFADSQVSSLLNTVFTLPATIANYNNAHQAREQCLFGKADQRTCDKLNEIEAETAELRHDGRELFRVGDIQAVLRNSETLLKLERKADDLRRDIVDEAARNGTIKVDTRHNSELVESVATRKGRDWGGEWDWELPKPFDNDRKRISESSEEDTAREYQELEVLLRLQSEVQKLVAAFDGAAWDDPPVETARRSDHSESRDDDHESREWSWARSWQWPQPGDTTRYDDTAYEPRVLEADRYMKNAGVPWREAYEDLLREERTERRGAHDEPSYEYSHDHEDQHDEPPSPKPNRQTFESQPQQNREYMAQLNKNENESSHDTASSGEEQVEETEMDVYEHITAAVNDSSSATPFFPPVKWNGANDVKPSILSTLTTTERTIASDGSVVTKVVLKKRFADGREESSESVHTQRGEPKYTEKWVPDSHQCVQDVQVSPSQMKISETTSKKSGWFWSS